MEPVVSEASRLMLPLIVLAVGLALLIAAWLFSRNYLKVAPNVVAVLSGRKRKLADGRVVGYRMVKGGAALKFPLLEKVDYLSLNVMTIPLEIKRAYRERRTGFCEGRRERQDPQRRHVPPGSR